MRKVSINSCLCFLLLVLSFDACYGRRVVVPRDFSRIADAFPTLTIGDTLVIRRGICSPSTNGESFPLNIPNGVFMVGENRDSCIVDAEASERVLSLSGLSSPFTSLENLTIRRGES